MATPSKTPIKNDILKEEQMVVSGLVSITRLDAENWLKVQLTLDFTELKLNYRAIEAVSNQDEKYKGLFKCENCGSNKTGFIQVQIDRADEPMTNFVFCYDCKTRFTK